MANELDFFAIDFDGYLPKLKRLGVSFDVLLMKLENRVTTWILDAIDDFDDGV